MPELKELVVWTIPLGIAVFAAYLGLSAYREKPWRAVTPVVTVAPAPCPERMYRCRDREVQISTGDVGPDGKMCMFRRVSSCLRSCATTHVTLTGIDDQVARRQLCDAPRRIDSLVLDERSFLGAPAADAEVCEGDGYIPTDDGFHQCVLKSGNDPMASGMVTGHVRCRYGAVATSNRTPMLIKREEAIGAWCKREANWSADTDVDDDAGPDASTDSSVDGAATDGAIDVKSGG